MDRDSKRLWSIYIGIVGTVTYILLTTVGTSYVV